MAVSYVFDVFVNARKVDTFKERYRKGAAHFKELGNAGYLDQFLPRLEYPPALHTKDVANDAELVNERGLALQAYYQRLLGLNMPPYSTPSDLSTDTTRVQAKQTLLYSKSSQVIASPKLCSTLTVHLLMHLF